jgi:mannose-1-phosphate guanylyltransferase
MKEDPRFFACIMAGGSGERFWPMSRQRSPKQLTKLFGNTTLIEDTVQRLEGIVRRENVFVLTNQVQLEATRAALPMLKPEQIVAEPAKRDTAPAAALAVALVRSRDPQGVMALLSSDALIHDGARCGQQISAALSRAAATDALLTFGIPPSFPSTGFGYLESGDEVARGADGSVIRQVRRFVEKPDATTAQHYLETRRFLWNAGMFVWRADAFLSEAERHAPGLATFIREFPAAHPVAGSGQRSSPGARSAAELYIEEHFPTLEPKVSLDYAIMEKAAAVEVVIADFDWDDVGLWTALPKHIPPDPSGNTVRGPATSVASTNNIVVSNGRMIALCGVKDLVVVETADAVLVCHRDAVQNIKQLVQQLPKELL